jgi:predicted AlkP superfamily pyrophosphatase or phosphodiesterase
MNKLFLFILLEVITVNFSWAQNDKPKLVVGIVVDQMRQEYLYRFEHRFGEDGFKKLINDGFMYKNAHFNYIPTKTAPGHATIYTGTTPAVHGIIGNDWYDREKGKQIYCTADDRYQTVGSDSKRGKMSPTNLMSSTITDELLLFSQQKSKVLSISIKDRSAILPAGHGGDAFWYDKDKGDFITSTYFMKELPLWIKKFNDRKLADQYSKATWNTLYNIDTYTASGPDAEPGEMTMSGRMSGFPYNLSKLPLDYENIIMTPFGNDLLTEITLAALDNVDFGNDRYSDFLAISFSSTDYVGHDSGPYSVEVEDTYLKLDKNIATIIKKLDEKIGKGNYTIFLTADHAIAPIPQYLMDRKFAGGYFMKKEHILNLENALVKRYGVGPWVEGAVNDQIYLNRNKAKEIKIDLDEVSQFVVDYLLELDGMADAFTADQVRQFSISGNDMKSQLARGYNAKRSGDVLYVLQPSWVMPYPTTATNHSSGYSYDTHVPMIWYGRGIKKGESVRYHSAVDIAPTLSMLLNITLPSGATGEPLYELFDEE